jgi:hypothetical protein
MPRASRGDEPLAAAVWIDREDAGAPPDRDRAAVGGNQPITAACQPPHPFAVDVSDPNGLLASA